MKHIIPIIALALCSLLPTNAQSTDRSTKMTEYGNGCRKLLEGIANKDKYALYEAKEELGKLNLEVIDPICEEGSKGEGKPLIMFCPEYADAMIKSNFLLQSLDDISIMRAGDDSDLLVFHKSVSAHGTLTYEWEGCGKCELMLVGKANDKLKVSITDTTSGKQYMALPDEEGGVSYVAWEMGTADGTYSIHIENTSDELVSFAIALN